MQILGDGRQRDIGDRAVHYGHNQAQRYGENGPVALRHREAVRNVGHGSCGIECRFSFVIWAAVCGRIFIFTAGFAPLQ